MKKVFVSFIFLLALFSLFFMSCNYQNKDKGKLGSLDWKFNNGELTISGNGPMPNLSAYSYPWDNHKLHVISVIINDGVTTIGDCAFFDRINLVSVTIPNTITYIGSASFKNCDSLYMIVIPENVMLIGERAFEGCTNLSIVNSLINNPMQTDAIISFYSIFPNHTINSGILFVPQNTAEAYKRANGWNDFKKIREKININNNDNTVTKNDETIKEIEAYKLTDQYFYQSGADAFLNEEYWEAITWMGKLKVKFPTSSLLRYADKIIEDAKVQIEKLPSRYTVLKEDEAKSPAIKYYYIPGVGDIPQKRVVATPPTRFGGGKSTVIFSGDAIKVPGASKNEE